MKRAVSICALPICLALAAILASTSFGKAPSTRSGVTFHVTWMKGFAAPGTPARYDKVGVIKVGSASAKNVLVLEPGTSAAAAYFVPFAQWVVSSAPNWQVWSVQRRENLLDDQSELNLAKEGKASPTQLFDYYLGYLSNKSITHHLNPIPTSSVEFAKQWGMNVAVQDLRRVIEAAQKLGGKVVLGGHSLGGAVVTAYATWDFGGHAGADGLSGLVYDDGGSLPAVSSQTASAELTSLGAPSATPWLAFGGIPAPLAGLLAATGGESTVTAPNAPFPAAADSLIAPFGLVPDVPVTNEAQYGYALNYLTSPPSLLAAQAHLGKGVSSRTVNGYHTWDGAGALTPVSRLATMFAGAGVLNATGTEWYFPQRLTVDTGAVANGNANPAQKVLDVDATMGHHLPRSLQILAICTALGKQGVLQDAQALAAQSHIPSNHLTLINRQNSYSHNDPAGAYPNNAFFSHLIPFLRKIAASR